MSDFDPRSIIERAPQRKAFAQTLEAALGRFKKTTGLVLTRGALGVALLSAPMSGCANELGNETEVLEQDLLNSSVLDWAQRRGERNTGMVRYEGTNWVELEDCSRWCMTANVFVRLTVAPVPGADLSQKQVGVMYRTTTSDEPRHGYAHYVRTLEDGNEEWQAVVPLRGWDPRIISFNAWYETGEWFWDGEHQEWRKRTFFDDNGGDLHVVAPGPSSWAIRSEGTPVEIQVGPQGVTGSVSARVANFDFDKDIQLVWSTDNWATVNAFGMGDGSYDNEWRYVEAVPGVPSAAGDFERWQIDISIPGPAEHFEYALVYRHGLGDGSQAYEFWDNNYFRNYRVEASAGVE